MLSQLGTTWLTFYSHFTSPDTEDVWGEGGGPSTISIKEEKSAFSKPQPAKRNISLKNGSKSALDFSSSEA